jgi:hypothetical protein
LDDEESSLPLRQCVIPDKKNKKDTNPDAKLHVTEWMKNILHAKPDKTKVKHTASRAD